MDACSGETVFEIIDCAVGDEGSDKRNESPSSDLGALFILFVHLLVVYYHRPVPHGVPTWMDKVIP
jgi:hypothetical protein